MKNVLIFKNSFERKKLGALSREKKVIFKENLKLSVFSTFPFEKNHFSRSFKIIKNKIIKSGPFFRIWDFS